MYAMVQPPDGVIKTSPVLRLRFSGSMMVFDTTFCRMLLSLGPLLLILEEGMVANGEQGRI